MNENFKIEIVGMICRIVALAKLIAKNVFFPKIIYSSIATLVEDVGLEVELSDGACVPVKYH